MNCKKVTLNYEKKDIRVSDDQILFFEKGEEWLRQ
jgi:hypothetical protein